MGIEQALNVVLGFTSLGSGMLLVLLVVVAQTNARPPMPVPSYVTVAEGIPVSDAAGTSSSPAE
jgi:hypothetical protein